MWGAVMAAVTWNSHSVKADQAVRHDLDFQVRSLLTTERASERRKLLDFIPTFSDDGMTAEMPLLTLQLKGLPGTPLSDDAYDAVQYAMSDYLREVLQERWPSTDTMDYDAGSMAMEARDNSITLTPALTSVKVEIVADRSIGGRRRRRRRQLQTGNEVDVLATLTFRDLASAAANKEGVEYNQAQASSSVPSDDTLRAAAGDAWNDLSEFEKYLYEAIGRQGDAVKQEFVALEGLASAEQFPTSPPTAAPTPGVTQPQSDGDQDRGDVGGTDNTVASVNDSSNLATNTRAINPLYPALIAGFAVFLCTIIVLGYRRRRSSDLIGNKSEVHVHDTFTLEGDEEIEVENPFVVASHSKKSGSFRTSRSIGHDGVVEEHHSYDVEDVEDDDSSEVPHKSKPSFCIRPPGMRAPRNLDTTYDDSFESDDYPGNDQLAPPSIGEVEREDMDLYADLTPSEKQQFLRYMHSGMSIEEASQLVLEARQNHALARSNTSKQNNYDRRSNHRLDSQVMSDGRTTVHIPEQLGDGFAPSSRNFQGSLVLKETDSSINSSFDDRDYHRNSRGSLLNLGRSRSRKNNEYSDLSSSGKSSGRRQKQRGEKTPGKAMGQNILCYPESAI
jgi:hypothetical protein